MGCITLAKRPKAAEWERALVRMYDQTVPCSNPACEAKTFVLVDGGAPRCPWCRTELKGPRQVPILFFYRPRQAGKGAPTTFTFDFRFVGWHGRKLNVWHVEPNRLPGPGVDPSPLGEIRWEAGGATGHWFLHNEGIGQILDVSDNHKSVAIVHDRIELREGMRLKFSGGDNPRVIEIHMQSLV